MMSLVRFLLKFVALAAVGLVMFILVGIPLGTWVYLLLDPSRVLATVIERNEVVYHGYSGSWKQYFRLKVNYTPSDTRVPEQATIDADEGTWEQSTVGSRVEIAYVPVTALRQFPMYYTKRLAEPLPPMSGVPDVQRSATAVIKNIHHIIKVGGGRGSRGMEAWQPFDVVELSFIPEGRTEPVTSVDDVDSGSVSNLAVEKRVTIDYPLRRPRAAKITGASREHEWKNAVEILAFPGVAALALLIFFTRNVWKTRH